jgi:RNA polymerase sigma-70 factor (ECF subfamily)
LVPIDGSDIVDDTQLGPAETLEKKELRERVQRALNELEPEDATVILLRDLQDIPYEDVARVLKIPVGTVKSRLHRARQALKTHLTAYFRAGRKAI